MSVIAAAPKAAPKQRSSGSRTWTMPKWRQKTHDFVRKHPCRNVKAQDSKRILAAQQ